MSEPVHTPEVCWVEGPFEALSTAELYAVLALRQRVFVVEQRCAYLDADGLDLLAEHVFALDEGSRTRGGGPQGFRDAIACVRVFAPGVRAKTEAVLGRVVSDPSWRRTGLGREVVRRGLARIEARWGAVPVRISAQRYLERFYASFGFETVGEPYLEDEIPHVAMLRPVRES